MTVAGTHSPPDGAAELHSSAGVIQRIQGTLHSHPVIGPVAILVITVAVFASLNPRFLEPRTLSLLLEQASVTAVLSIGQTLILLTAGIDLSVGAITVLASMVMGKLCADLGIHPALAIGAGIIVAGLCGISNGLLVTRFRLPPFIVTLGTLSIFTAIMLLYSNGQTVQGSSLPPVMTMASEPVRLGSFNITYGLIVVAVVTVLVSLAMRNTSWGRHVRAVGDDAPAARLAGVRVQRTLLTVYLCAGVIYGIGAWVLMGRVGGASPNAVGEINLETITAAVIGGTSLFGGRGGVVGSIVGALIVQSFAVGLALINVDGQYRLLAVGVLVISAVALDRWIRRVQ